MISAIQFIGTQRSGSNLLRLILNQHPSISAPHPPHLLKTFIPLMAGYDGESGLKKLVDDMCRWVEVNPVPWSKVTFDRQAILSRSTTVFDVFRSIYEAKAKADQADIWCCKSTFNIEYVDEIEKHIRPFYIYLFRDGRDVAVSFKNAIVGPKHIYNLAVKWREEQRQSIDFLKGVDEERKIAIRFEDLIDNPVNEIEKICSKIGITYDSSMMNYYTSEESLHTAESGRMWENVVRPIMKENKGKFLTALSRSETELFEHLAGSVLEELGYKREIPLNGNNIKLDVADYNRQNSLMMEEAKQKALKKDIENRKAQERLLVEIKERFSLST